jgi:hypothetical protein
VKAELVEDARHVPLDRCHADHEFLCCSGVGAAFSDQREHIPLSRRQVAERPRLALSVYEACNHGGIKRRPSAGYPSHGLGEHAQVADVLLEEITDALSAVGDKGHRVAVFEELRKHQHAHAWHSGPDLKRRAKPVVGVIRRHLDIGDNDVRTLGTRYPHNVASILRGADDLEAVVLQDVHDTFPENRLVLADDSTGRSSRTSTCNSSTTATTGSAVTRPGERGAVEKVRPLLLLTRVRPGNRPD